MKIMIACGGTGGHLFPGLAVAESLRARGDRVLLVVSEKEIDRVATATLENIAVKSLPGIGLPSLFSPQIFRFGTQFVCALHRANSLMTTFKPDAILGMGGFACAAPILAASRRHIPTFLHESNAIPGKANRFIARFATEVFVGLETCADKFRQQATVTGTPVRADLQKLPAADARKQLGLHPNRFTVLVLGGSQGARALNDLVLAALDKNIQFIHSTGHADFDHISRAYRTVGITAHVQPFITEMNLAYSAADLAISRAGAGTLAELAWFELPSLLIPFPHAAEQHQHRNAEIFESAGAAKMLPQESLDGHLLDAFIEQLRLDRPRLAAMAASAARLKRPAAAKQIMQRMDEHRFHPILQSSGLLKIQQ